MKIILAAKSVYPFHPFGGVQKYVYYLAKYLTKEGIDLEIVAPLDDGKERTEVFEGVRYQFLKPSIYRYLEYPIGWLGVHLFNYTLAKYLRDKDFDVLHSFDMVSYQYLQRPHRRPVIAQIFSDNYLSNPISFQNPFNSLSLFGYKNENIKKQKIRISPFSKRGIKLRYFPQYSFKIRPMYFCLKNADMIFFEEEMFRCDVEELFRLQGEKHSVLPAGIDLSLINEKTKVPSLTRSSLGLSAKDLVLITVNRLAADKGVDKLVLALEEALHEIPRLKLMIVGMGYQEKEILQWVRERKLTDYIRHFKNLPEDDLYDLYRLCDIYISAFSYPGSSMSTLEAMACGRPCVATRIGGNEDLLCDGENGRLVEPDDPNQLATFEPLEANR